MYQVRRYMLSARERVTVFTSTNSNYVTFRSFLAAVCFVSSAKLARRHQAFNKLVNKLRFSSQFRANTPHYRSL